MVYLADIAKEAGVSISTVSRVMNNHPAISDETKARVVAAAQKLGYRRNVSNPVTKSTANCVGVLIPDILTDYYTRLVYFLEERFRKKDYSIVTMSTDYSQEQAVRAVQQMAGFGVRCLVIMLGDSEEISDQLTTAVRASGIPVMFITTNYIPTMDFEAVEEFRREVALQIRSNSKNKKTAF